MSSGTSGATIYYTTDGSTPDGTDTEYTEAITLPGSTTTFKAIAVLAGKVNSAVRTAVYTMVDTGGPYTDYIDDDYTSVIVDDDTGFGE